MNEIEKKAAEIRDDAAKAAKAETEKVAAELKSELKQKTEELNATKNELAEAKTSIENLDKSLKEVNARVEMMKKANADESIKGAIKATLESAEVKAGMERVAKGEVTNFKFEIKASSPTITSSSMSVQLDPAVSSARHTPNAFLNRLPSEVGTADVIAWVDGSYTSNVGYVDEIAEATGDSATATEKQRKYGKMASKLPISADAQDWYQQIVAWAQNEGVRYMEDKVDGEIINGDGDDTGSNRHICGLKTQGSTAFAALGKYEAPTIAEVIHDAAMQAAKNGYVANAAYISYKAYTELKAIKDKNGRPMYDAVTGMLGAIAIVPSARLTDNELYVMDERAVKVYRKRAFEAELERKASSDSYVFHLRGYYQTRVTEADKKGVIYVADYTTAITEITEA